MNGETSREGMTNPSSSTPASPPEHKFHNEACGCISGPEPTFIPSLEPEKKCLKRIADFMWGFHVVGIDGQEVEYEGNFMLGVACGQLLDFEDNDEAVKAIQAYAASVRAASTGTGWIPVSEKLPPKNDPVIVFDSMCDEVAEGQISAYGWEKSIGKDDCEITAWQPFPAPPVASQKGKEEE
jgi:hypothetical protein